MGGQGSLRGPSGGCGGCSEVDGAMCGGGGAAAPATVTTGGEAVVGRRGMGSRPSLSSHSWGEYRWPIHNFSRIKENFLYSETFDIGLFSWRLLIYPKGDKEADHIALFLNFSDAGHISTDASPKAHFELIVENHLFPCSSQREETDHIFTAAAPSLGWHEFLSLAEAYDHRKGFIFEDTIVIKVRIRVETSRVCKVAYSKWAQQFDNPEHSDVVIIGPDNRRIFCHRAYLAMWSEPFSRMLKSDMIEGRSSEIRINEVDPIALEGMLRFMYTGSCEITDENVVQLTAIADRFDIKELLQICANPVISKDNCCKMLQQAIQYHIDGIMDKCSEFLLSHVEGMGKDQSFLDLGHSCIDGMLTCAAAKHRVGFEVFMMVARWVEHSRKDRDKYAYSFLKRFDFGKFNLEEVLYIASLDIVCQCPNLKELVFQRFSTIGKSRGMK